MTFDELLKNLPAILAAILVGVLFLQSSLDKIFDWSGNLEWLTAHFSKTFLAGTVPPMLAVITLMELVTGILSFVGVFYFVFTASTILIFYASVIGALAIIALFFGQRVAKDYPGAAVLVPYFILAIILMILTNPYTR